jgi:hypothetical protein
MVNHRDRLAEINASAAPSLTVAGVRSRNRSGERDDRVVFAQHAAPHVPFKAGLEHHSAATVFVRVDRDVSERLARLDRGDSMTCFVMRCLFYRQV